MLENRTKLYEDLIAWHDDVAVVLHKHFGSRIEIQIVKSDGSEVFDIKSGEPKIVHRNDIVVVYCNQYTYPEINVFDSSDERKNFVITLTLIDDNPEIDPPSLQMDRPPEDEFDLGLPSFEPEYEFKSAPSYEHPLGSEVYNPRHLIQYERNASSSAAKDSEEIAYSNKSDAIISFVMMIQEHFFDNPDVSS